MQFFYTAASFAVVFKNCSAEKLQFSHVFCKNYVYHPRTRFCSFAHFVHIKSARNANLVAVSAVQKNCSSLKTAQKAAISATAEWF